MSRFVLTPAARADVEEIHDFIHLDSPAAAARVRVALRDSMRRLATHPHLGHLRQDLADEALRFWPVFSYLVVYRPDTDLLKVRYVCRFSQVC